MDVFLVADAPEIVGGESGIVMGGGRGVGCRWVGWVEERTHSVRFGPSSGKSFATLLGKEKGELQVKGENALYVHLHLENK